MDTVKTWTSSLNNQFSSAVDQAVEYREAVYALIQALLAAGWTVERSSDGTTAGAGNQIGSAAECVFGTEASQAHAWIVFIPPSGKGNPGGGDAFRLVLNCNNSNADTTPQNLDIYLAHGSYSGGSTTTRPTVTGTEDSVLAWNVIAWATAVAGRHSSWYTSDGDVYFGVKTDGATAYRSFFWIRDDPVNALGLYTMSVFANSNASDALTAALLQTTASHRNFHTDGSAAAAASRTIPRSVIWDLTNWANGQEAATGQVPRGDLRMTANAAASQRDLGFLLDVQSVPGQTAFNGVDANDPDAIAPLVIGDIMMPTTIAQAPVG